MEIGESITLAGIIVAVVATVASWSSVIVNMLQINRKRIEEFQDDWAKCRAFREDFWKPLELAYNMNFSSKSSTPTTLDDLIDAVLMPPNLPVRKGRTLNDWVSDNKGSLRPDQRTMLEFVQGVYPPKQGRTGDVMDYSTIDDSYKRSFHKARRELSEFYNKWPKRLGIRRIKSSEECKRKELIMLCWLDIAIRQWVTTDKGPGKVWMYKLGNVAKPNTD